MRNPDRTILPRDSKSMTPIRIVFAAILAACLLAPAAPAKADIEVRVNKAAQRMAVIIDGINFYSWPVSTGLGGGPRSGTYTPQRLERKWNSRKYNWAPMPYSVFFHEGYAIHGTTHVRNLGRRASKGCVRLHPDHAAILFNLVKKRGMKSTTIVIEQGATAGTERSRRVRPLAAIR
jgi:lipoprotein-anchoring transpeptidase ErfK/SrfK